MATLINRDIWDFSRMALTKGKIVEQKMESNYSIFIYVDKNGERRSVHSALCALNIFEAVKKADEAYQYWKLINDELLQEEAETLAARK